MKKVTALRVGRGKQKRLNVFLDGRFAFSLDSEVVAKQGLRVGQEISDVEIGEMAESDQFHRCLNTATRYLSYRPRSESELRNRLRQRGFSGDSIDEVLTKLKEQGFVDDVAFAKFWKDNRESFSPRSQWLTGWELRQKGVASPIVDKVVNAIDDGDSAYRAARNKARTLPLNDYQSYRRRLGEYLKRRGFGYGVIIRAVERLWQEGVGKGVDSALS